jgi:hypothetical protein
MMRRDGTDAAIARSELVWRNPPGASPSSIVILGRHDTRSCASGLSGYVSRSRGERQSLVFVSADHPRMGNESSRPPLQE